MAKRSVLSGKIPNPNDATESVTISPPNLKTEVYSIVGTVPMLHSRFGEVALEGMRRPMELGTIEARKAKKVRSPRNFDLQFEESQHKMKGGGWGIPCSAFRAAMIRACSLTDVPMTMARMSLFVEADGFGVDGTPLVRMDCKAPVKREMYVSPNGNTDIRVRAEFAPGWKARVRIRFDADQLKREDVARLLMRVGQQMGLLSGRSYVHGSTGSGLGYGHFDIIG